MTRDEIIYMAREAGLVDWTLHNRLESKEEVLERFAALVAAAERENCAKVCEENTAAWTEHVHNAACMGCADVIRARGDE